MSLLDCDRFDIHANTRSSDSNFLKIDSKWSHMDHKS